MATRLSIYQRLVLDEPQHTLRLRKHASRRLLAFEQAVDERQSERLTILGCMRDEGATSRREAAAGTVNATSLSQGASEPQRVPDSFDARPGSQRVSERPYSEGTFRRDVRQGRSPASRCGTCVSYSVPVWATGLPQDVRAAVATSPRVFAEPQDERDERQPLIRQRGNDARAEQAARLRLAAGTIRMAEQD